MRIIPSEGMFTNSGIFTARFAAVEFSIKIAGLSLPWSSFAAFAARLQRRVNYAPFLHSLGEIGLSDFRAGNGSGTVKSPVPAGSR